MKILRAAAAVFVLVATAIDAKAEEDANAFRRRTKLENVDGSTTGTDSTEKNVKELFEDDAAFWHRFLPKEIKSFTRRPTQRPSQPPSPKPSSSPSSPPSPQPSSSPSSPPSPQPSSPPSHVPSKEPSSPPSPVPSQEPSRTPSLFPSTVACEVETEIKCTTAGGLPCVDIVFPEGSCSTGGPIDIITFSYQSCTCDESQNEQEGIASCEDCGPFTSSPVIIMCQDENGVGMTVSPMVVQPNSPFTVTNPAGSSLPETLDCSIFALSGDKVQRDIINTSGNVTLELKDKFGAFTVESCNELNCFEETTYEYDISNVGNNFMNITRVEVTTNGVTVSFLDLVPVNPLGPGQTTTIIENRTINICEEVDYSVELEVDANSPDGGTCFANDTYTFDINPKCKVNAELSCTVDGTDGTIQCVDIIGEKQLQCRCTTCANQVIFSYTGAACDATNVGSNGLLACTDFVPGPGTMVRVIVSDVDGVVYDNTVSTGTDIVVARTGACLGSILRVQVLQPMTVTVLQELLVDAACTDDNDITLLNSFGALDFIGYTCDGAGEEPHNCFADVTYDLFVENIGSVDFNITDFDFTFQGVTTDLLQGIPEADLILSPGTDYKTNKTRSIERCANTMYSAEMSVNGTSEDTGAICRDKEVLKFDITTNSPFPTEVPSTAPSRFPSEEPSPVPSATPSSQPSSIPSEEPSPVPSAPPSPVPTSPPSSVPSSQPSPVPSSPPSPVPSQEPSSAPSPIPSQTPTEASLPPSSMPTTPCMLDLNSTCVSPTGVCEDSPPLVTQCTGRPVRMVMLYNGGDCSQAFNVQGEQGLYECFDIGDGPPLEGTEPTFSFIKVVSLKDATVIYHEDWVEVGQNYDLTLPAGQTRVEANMNITIYSTNITEPQFQLQNLRYHSSCSANLFLKDRFGASQLVEWENIQGIITCFTTSTFTFQLTIPVDIEAFGDNITLTSAISVTNFGIFNLTDDVNGLVLTPGATLSLDYNVTLDLTERRRYTGLTTITGFTEKGVECRGIDFFSFLAGNELPDTFPSLAPTSAPSVTPGPTPNPLEAACQLRASIDCILGDGSDCTGLGPPANTVCVGENPSQLRFIYNGLPCTSSNTTGRNYVCATTNGGVSGQSQVFVSITDRNNAEVYYRGIIPLSGQFLVNGRPNLADRLIIQISTVDPNTGEPLLLLQAIQMRATCVAGQDDISLMTQYGALELVSFTSDDQGTNIAFVDIILTYSVTNAGKLTAIAESASRTSDLQGDRILISPPGVQLARDLTRSFQDISRLNLFTSAGRRFVTVLTVSGVGLLSNTGCGATATSTLTIGA